MEPVLFQTYAFWSEVCQRGSLRMLPEDPWSDCNRSNWAAEQDLQGMDRRQRGLLNGRDGSPWARVQSPEQIDRQQHASETFQVHMEYQVAPLSWPRGSSETRNQTG